MSTLDLEGKGKSPTLGIWSVGPKHLPYHLFSSSDHSGQLTGPVLLKAWSLMLFMDYDQKSKL